MIKITVLESMMSKANECPNCKSKKHLCVGSVRDVYRFSHGGLLNVCYGRFILNIECEKCGMNNVKENVVPIEVVTIDDAIDHWNNLTEKAKEKS